MLDFTGQFVLVTGAGGNVGSAVAQTLARLGARLALAGGSEQRLHALAARLGGAAPVLIHGADARTADGAARIAAEAAAATGAIDALVNTVGTFRTAEVADGASRDWPMLMELNALAALRLCEAVLPPMRARGYGRIVHVGAGAALRAFAGAAAYAASKAALLRIVEAVAEENKGLGITANCVLPGTIDTPQNRAAMPDADPTRWVRPEEIAAVIAFLVSRESGGVTGAAVPVPGRQ